MVAHSEWAATSKIRVFISYSRKDSAFVDQLEAALKARGFDTMIDRSEIYAFEDWWKRIEAVISRADTVVFVLSYDSAKSGVALREVAYAASINKRVAPIVFRRVEDSLVPDVLRRLNFIFFDEQEHFEANADQLAEAMQTDIGWIRQHTDYGEAARVWSARGRLDGLLLHSPVLEEAERWIEARPHRSLEPTPQIRSFIADSRRAAIGRRRRRLALIVVFGAVLVGVLAAWHSQQWLKERIYAVTNVTALTAAQEYLLKPKDTFKECSKCPEMIVVPAGSLILGWATYEDQPLRNATIPKPFAISKLEVTFDEWSACVAQGNCDAFVKDQNQQGRHSVGNLRWDDARSYVAWLSRITGKNYRLLSEAEYEYAVRIQAVELGGWEMFEDCWHDTLHEAPSDGSPWVDVGGCNEHVVRVYKSRLSASRDGRTTDVSFRIGRTLPMPKL